MNSPTFRLAVLLLTALLGGRGASWATCDAVPGTQGRFRGVRGTIDRPFASPGDPVEVGLDPQCHPGAVVLGPDAVVTLVFSAPAAPAHAIVIAPSCAGLTAATLQCEAELAGGTATCVSAASVGLQTIERDGHAALRFRFPDTDAVLASVADPGSAHDGRTLTGPLTIAVTQAGAPLPCGLAHADCGAQPGALACIDDLFLDDGGCGATPHPVFDRFTALPPANDFGALCTDPSPPCTGDAAELLAAVDRAGNLLVPMDWRRVLVRRADVPVPRLLRGAIRLEAFAGSGLGLQLPDETALGAFSLQGAPLPPIFTPQRDPAATDRLTLFGSADAPAGVLRIARRPQCVGGPRDGAVCRHDDDCTPASCGGGLFNFADRVFEGAGPLVLRRGGCLGGERALATCTTAADCPGGDCVTFGAQAADPVPLDGLNTTPGGFAFVVNETLVQSDRNGDGDRTDDVIQLIDGLSGQSVPIGDGGVGRAVARLRQPPFTRPALVTGGDTVAFLEPEALAGEHDANGDGDRADTLLRAYRVGGGTAVDLTGGQALVADAAPVIDGDSLHIAGDRLFFRTSEAAAAHSTTRIVSYDYTGQPVSDANQLTTPQALSADGRFITFLSVAPNVTPDDRPCNFSGLCRDAFLLDRDADENGIFDEAGGTAVVRVSAGEQSAPTSASAISADGRVVAFISTAATLVSGDTNRLPDVFVYERDTGAIERVSVGPGGMQAEQGVVDGSGALAISADGSVIAFASASAQLVFGDLNEFADVFVHDRRTQVTEMVSGGLQGTGADGPSFIRGFSTIGLSADGRLVAFDSDATNLVVGDGNLSSDVFVHDRAADVTRRVSVGVRGEEANAPSRLAAFAADGGTVAFASNATNLVPGVRGGFGQLFAYDLGSDATSLVSAASDGTPGDASASEAALSADGRLVAFSSGASNLVPDDRNAITDVFLHDRLTGITDRVSLTAPGGEVPQVQPQSESGEPAVPADGRSTVFIGTEDLVPGVQRHRAVFTRTADVTDTASDLTGDGRLDAVVLRALDLTAPPGTPPRTLCPAVQVATSGDTAVFLRPEAMGDAAGCPVGPDLNGDGDAADLVVHRVAGDGAVENLGLAARAIASSGSVIAALVPESEQGAADLVLAIRPNATTGAWTNVGLAADTVLVRGDTVAFIVPEAAQGADLNADGDLDDRVLHLVAANGAVRNLGLAVEEMVASDTLLAFRTREASQGGADLNGDGDAADDVLFVYDLGAGALRPTGQAITPCRLEVCDPRLPYRPLRHSVRFLTLEADQGEDLNGDGDAADLVLQTFNLMADVQTSLGRARTDRAHRRGARTIAAVGAGFCTSNGAACAVDAACPDRGRCIVPPGRCFADTHAACVPGDANHCRPDEYCGSDPGSTRTTCRRSGGECRGDGDCDADERCAGEGQTVQRLGALIAAGSSAEAIPGVGRCIDPVDGRELGTCRTDDDCSAPAACRADLVSAALGDRDGDEIPDSIDGCPDIADPLQRDGDDDGVGDACDRRTAGNGRREPGEECDGEDDAACRNQCQPDATCFCAELAPAGASVRLGVRPRGRFTARVPLALPSYDGESVLVRVNASDGRLLATGGAETFERVGQRRWVGRGLSPGLQRLTVERRAGDKYRVVVRARDWLPADATAPLRLTITAGNHCVATVKQGAVPTTTSTTTTIASTTTTTTSTTTTVTSSTTTTTIAPGCCGAHRMVLETTGGGIFALGVVGGIPLPAGTRITVDVGPPDASCRHSATIPPGGFEMPPFCVPGLNWTADLVARGCAAGEALGRGTVWDGGAASPDPDVSVQADTRDGVCNPPGQACSQQEFEAAANALGSQTISNGDGEPNPVGMHLSLALPVIQRTWDPREPGGGAAICPDTKPVGNVEERVNATYSQLRLTTGQARAAFVDRNADGCRFSGLDSGAPRAVQGHAAAGPCCVVGQEMELVAASAEFTAGFIGDVLSTATFPARVVACEAPHEPASCDAVSGGGRVVTAMSENHSEARGVFPAANGGILIAGSVHHAGSFRLGMARYDSDGRLDRTFGPDGSGRAIATVDGENDARGTAMDSAGRVVVAGIDYTRRATSGLDGVVARLLPDGRLDSTFGNGGSVRLQLPTEDELSGVAVDAVGRVVVVGRTQGVGDDFLIARLLPSGELDPSFGAGGMVATDFSAINGAERLHDRALGVGVDAQGRIVVVGKVGGVTDNPDEFRTRFAVARYLDDGRLDDGFGSGGLVITDVGPFGGEARTVLMLPDGGLIASGSRRETDGGGPLWVVVRYREGGSLDEGFGVGGIARLSPTPNDFAGVVAASAIQPDGQLLVGGRARPAEEFAPSGESLLVANHWALMRLDLATAEPDSSFGHNGVVITSFGGFYDELQAILPLPDGRVVASGIFDRNGGYGYEGEAALARYLSDGRADPTFGGECAWEVEAEVRVEQ